MKARNYPCDEVDCHSLPRPQSLLLRVEESVKNQKRKISNLKIIGELAKGSSKDSSHSSTSHDIPFRTIKREQYGREISKLSKRYQREFYTISSNFESWASRRRILINRLHTYCKSIERTKKWCERGKFTFSSMCALGAAASIILDKWNVASAPKVLFVATTIGSLSLICSLVELYKKKDCVEDFLKLFQAEEEEFEALERNIRRSTANTDLKTIFPHGVDFRVLKNELAVEKNNCDLAFKDDSDVIFFAILLSNAKKDPELLNNEEFISKVKNFSNSRVAKTWWNRLKYKNSSYNAEKSKLYQEMKSLLVLNPNAFPVLSLAAWPMSYSDFLPALGVFIIHSIVTFDAFCELSVKIASKETTTFKRLKRILAEEYEELKKVYNVLTPYNE